MDEESIRYGDNWVAIPTSFGVHNGGTAYDFVIGIHHTPNGTVCKVFYFGEKHPGEQENSKHHRLNWTEEMYLFIANHRNDDEDWKTLTDAFGKQFNIPVYNEPLSSGESGIYVKHTEKGYKGTLVKKWEEAINLIVIGTETDFELRKKIVKAASERRECKGRFGRSFDKRILLWND